MGCSLKERSRVWRGKGLDGGERRMEANMLYGYSLSLRIPLECV